MALRPPMVQGLRRETSKRIQEQATRVSRSVPVSLINTMRLQRLEASQFRLRPIPRRSVPAWLPMLSFAGLVVGAAILVISFPFWGGWLWWKHRRTKAMRRDILRIELALCRDRPHLRPALLRLWRSYLSLHIDMRWIVGVCVVACAELFLILAGVWL